MKTEPLLEVEIQRQGARAMDFYRAKYEERYGMPPILQGVKFANGMTILKDVIRKVGQDRMLKMLAWYLKSNGDNGWYKKMGHTLQTFEKNVEQINTSVGTEKTQYAQVLQLRVRTRCKNENCKKIFLLAVSSDKLENTYDALCETCEKTDAKKDEQCYF